MRPSAASAACSMPHARVRAGDWCSTCCIARLAAQRPAAGERCAPPPACQRARAHTAAGRQPTALPLPCHVIPPATGSVSAARNLICLWLCSQAHSPMHPAASWPGTQCAVLFRPQAPQVPPRSPVPCSAPSSPRTQLNFARPSDSTRCPQPVRLGLPGLCLVHILHPRCRRAAAPAPAIAPASLGAASASRLTPLSTQYSTQSVGTLHPAAARPPADRTLCRPVESRRSHTPTRPTPSAALSRGRLATYPVRPPLRDARSAAGRAQGVERGAVTVADNTLSDYYPPRPARAPRPPPQATGRRRRRPAARATEPPQLFTHTRVAAHRMQHAVSLRAACSTQCAPVFHVPRSDMVAWFTRVYRRST